MPRCSRCDCEVSYEEWEEYGGVCEDCYEGVEEPERNGNSVENVSVVLPFSTTIFDEFGDYGKHITLVCLDDEKMVFHDTLERWFNFAFPDTEKTVYYSCFGRKKEVLEDNEFCISCYCLPEEKNLRHTSRTRDYIDLIRDVFVDFERHQRSFLVPDRWITQDVLEEKFYTHFFGMNGTLFVAQKNNKLYIPNTLFSATESFSRIRKWFETYCFIRMKNGLNFNFFNDVEPSEEEKQKIMEQRINKWFRFFLDTKKNVEEQKLEISARQVMDSERMFRDNLRVFHETKNRLTPFLEKLRRFNPKAVIEKLVKLPFVDSVTASQQSLTIQTKNIFVGKFYLGNYKIVIPIQHWTHPNIFTPIKDHSVFHPYQYNHRHRDLGTADQFCFGTYNEIYVKCVENCLFDQALMAILKVLTNYSTGTRMNDIESYLKKLGNKKVLTTIRSYAKTELNGWRNLRIKRLTDGMLEIYAEKINSYGDKRTHSFFVSKRLPMTFQDLEGETT